MIDPRYRHQLKAAIVAAGFKTQKEFCAETGLNGGTLSLIINGYMTPIPAVQRRLSDVLNITIDELREIL